LHPEAAADVIEYFAGEECDLSLVVVAVIEETIPANAMRGNALNLRHGAQRMFCRGLTMVTEEIMTGRDKQVTDNHGFRYPETALAVYAPKK
jgi:hypothetical protein